MTPRYTWTPASEPPDSERMVLVWGRYLSQPTEGVWIDWMFDPVFGWDDGTDYEVTHWKDVKRPEEDL